MTPATSSYEARGVHPEHFFAACEHGLRVVRAGLSEAADGYVHAYMRVSPIDARLGRKEPQ